MLYNSIDIITNVNVPEWAAATPNNTVNMLNRKTFTYPIFDR